MKKRLLAAILWFYALWCVGAALQMAVGLPEVFGPLAGVVAAYILLVPAFKARHAKEVAADTPRTVGSTSAVHDSV